MQQRKPRIGLTGGIGSGKSTVAQFLQAQGCAIVDADAIARSVASPQGSALDALAAAFGSEYITPERGLNRAAMRELVFHNPALRVQLESVLRPFILQGIADAAQVASADEQVQAIVFDIPLLVENLPQWRPLLDCVIVVDCSTETQIKRVLARSSSSGWTRTQVEGVIAAQATRAARLAAADFVIKNENIDLNQLQERTIAVWQAIRHCY